MGVCPSPASRAPAPGLGKHQVGILDTGPVRRSRRHRGSSPGPRPRWPEPVFYPTPPVPVSVRKRTSGCASRVQAAAIFPLPPNERGEWQGHGGSHLFENFLGSCPLARCSGSCCKAVSMLLGSSSPEVPPGSVPALHGEQVRCRWRTATVLRRSSVTSSAVPR